MLKEGMIIEGPFWPEPVELKKVEEFGDRIHIIGATIYSNTHNLPGDGPLAGFYCAFIIF